MLRQGNVANLLKETMGTLPLADEYFLVSHDEYSGKPLIKTEVLDTGLAGAVLAELALAGRILIAADTGLVTVGDGRDHGERVSDAALAEIRKRREAHPTRAWVEYLREAVREMVAPRLIQTGLVRETQARTLLRTSVRYPAVEPLEAARPRARLRYVLDHPANLDCQSAVLGGLVRATGLEHVLGAGTTKEARERLGRMVRQLPAGLVSLCSGVDNAVGAIALTVRR